MARVNHFNLDYRIKKRGYDTQLLKKTIELLAEGQGFPPECRDHALSGNYSGRRECHIAPDWLLVYEIAE